ncbi:hypothetical protein L2E82_11907 [Cichorium intybus]|uniref:Uncharacterized protein n=1 Tax=Cichorium intybus TaxID=13427 RepID=A0ACB9GEL0_CICIN|nr:hypothetical protein L2E82_11907 [Cichorium intybus]
MSSDFSDNHDARIQPVNSSTQNDDSKATADNEASETDDISFNLKDRDLYGDEAAVSFSTQNEDSKAITDYEWNEFMVEWGYGKCVTGYEVGKREKGLLEEK